MALYQSENCPCPADCSRHGQCKVCIAFHHDRGQLTFCEQLQIRQDTGSSENQTAASGRQIRLMDYGACAG